MACGGCELNALVGHRSFLIALFAILAILPVVTNPYFLFVANLIFVYTILALGLNMLVGFAGQFALANAAMFGIGAYTTGLTQVRLGFSYWFALPSGAVLAALVGTLIALPALRISGLYLALATLAFAHFTQWVFLQWEEVTYGAGGFHVPPVDFSWLGLEPEFGVYYLSWLVSLGLLIFAWLAMRSRIGRAFVAIRDSEVAAETLGIDLLKYKTLAFALSGFFAGIAGGLYCAMLNFVAPEGYDLYQVILQKAMIVLGGLGSVVGSVLGALFLVIANEVLREFKSAQEIAFGAVLLVTVLFMPKGIASQLKRWLPGWEEPFHIDVASRAGAAPPEVAFLHESGRAAPRPRASDKSILSVQDVSIAFGGVHALENVSAEIRPGEIFGIIGPNGAGKTTLVNVISGLNKGAAGRVSLDGTNISGLKPSAIAALGIGRTFQTSQLFPGLTVLENMMVGLHLGSGAGLFSAAFRTKAMREEEAEMVARAREALRYVAMEQFADRPGDALSFGQQRIVEIARTLINRPKVVLLDEPAAGLDVNRVAELDRLLRRIRDEHGVTLVLIEHVIRLVMGVSDRVLVLNSGVKIAEGTPEEIRRDQQVIQAYLGRGIDAGRSAP